MYCLIICPFPWVYIHNGVCSIRSWFFPFTWLNTLLLHCIYAIGAHRHTPTLRLYKNTYTHSSALSVRRASPASTSSLYFYSISLRYYDTLGWRWLIALVVLAVRDNGITDFDPWSQITAYTDEACPCPAECRASNQQIRAIHAHICYKKQPQTLHCMVNMTDSSSV